MSGRTTAEIVADLNRVDGSPTVGTLRREAADRLDELDAALDAQIAIGADLARVAFDAPRPPCPTCDGEGFLVAVAHGEVIDSKPCPENGGNCDGKVSIEQLVATYNAVRDLRLSTDGNWVHTADGMVIAAVPLMNYLRSVKP